MNEMLFIEDYPNYQKYQNYQNLKPLSTIEMDGMQCLLMKAIKCDFDLIKFP